MEWTITGLKQFKFLIVGFKVASVAPRLLLTHNYSDIGNGIYTSTLATAYIICYY